MIYFNIEKYKFLCGISKTYDRFGTEIVSIFKPNYALWMWNGYYYGILFQHLSGEDESRSNASAKVEQNKLDFPENFVEK